MDVQAIEQGLANAAAAITGLRCFPTLPDSINPPTFAPVDLGIEYHQAFRGLTNQLFTCGAYVSAGYTDAGRVLLAGYMAESGSSSIPAALEANKTLGGVCGDIIVERVRGAYRLYTVGGSDYMGAMFDVRVWA